MIERAFAITRVIHSIPSISGGIRPHHEEALPCGHRHIEHCYGKTKTHLGAENRACKKNSRHIFSILFGGNTKNTVQIFFTRARSGCQKGHSFSITFFHFVLTRPLFDGFYRRFSAVLNPIAIHALQRTCDCVV